MSHFSQFLAVAVIHFLALISPGPDFAMISRSSLVYSRRSGIYSALGLALGILVHVTYSLVGIGLIISQSILLFSIIKYFGAGYLIYIGIKSLRARRVHQTAKDPEAVDRHLPALAALRVGFLTNVLNPKVTLFFLGLFTQVIRPDTPLWLQVLYGLWMSLVTFLWFAFVASVLSHSIIRRRFVAVQHIVERVCGGLLIALGVRVAVDQSR
ncbi:MAG TPA: amino acid transporter [Candidatus Peribacter riflensis]|uniref:Lysine exporter protein LysE/YggA n=1 Tax=Candidatus Peribacter riflensis TaxID=1735162 RepID=A0A0S1SH03_9BACT|nr:MAG: lysine exporter protein LysE/YggA [Candidatus Peribacter riflensis]OGJ78293.1 MAG: amino acid transporter [Candidatus Peribacteria bacterium RIFOXYB1_FULL_57_12]OGJ81950.1 MAG: amino acid transporter [Candidatus Peribacteria bacterium RIFOXYC1_FULL_58_8]ALM10822.1 MAG: lysine exporter protein LysE/YggA [Candidatus Peribacter riflensis]ALM11924.1 MAG: lysine exporter protein LysE/YggA [Candidatus Peribacter riflensis]